MASDYPGGLDAFDTIASDKKASDAVGGRTHRDMHNDLGDAIEAIETELGTDPSGSAATVKARLDAIETAGQFAAFGTVGNLLTENQASGTDTLGNTAGFGAYNSTLDSSTADCSQGSRSLLVTSTVAGWCSAYTPFNTQIQLFRDSSWELYPSPFTFLFDVRKASGSPQVRAVIIWLDSVFTPISSTAGDLAAAPAMWGSRTVTGVPPSNARYAVCEISVSAEAIGNAIYVDRLSMHRGAGGTWQMPGVPIVNTGIRPNPANTAEVQIWNDATATWITV